MHIKRIVDVVDEQVDKKTDLIRLLLVLGTIEGALWSQGRAQQVWFVVATVTLIVCALWDRPGASELGLGWRGFAGASWALPIAAVASSTVLMIAWHEGTLRVLYGQGPIWTHSLGYAIWALEQQFILNSFFYRRFENLMGNNGKALVTTAVLFSLVHIPNPVLVPATLVGGLFFVAIFQRFRNIYPLAVAHALMGLTLAVSIPDHWLRHMRVGLGFFRFHIQG